MADAQANININLDASQALAQLRALQAEISTFQQKMLKLNASTAASAANVQRNLLNTINATGKFSAGMTTVASSTETFTNSLEKNKFSMGEYFRYAGGASKTFGKLFTNEFNTIEKVARERVKTLQTQYIKLGREANGAMKAISVRPLALDMDNLATKTMIAAQKQQILNQLLRQGSTNLLNWGKNTQWAGRQLMVGFTIPLTIFGSVAAKTFMELEEQAIRFKRVYGELFTTQEETDKMLDQLKALGSEFTKYGVALKDTMAMAADAAAMGKTGVDLLAQVSQASRLAVLGGVEQQQALETTISLTNAFGVATEDLTKKIDFLNAVENQTVVSIEDLTIAIPKAGPVVKQLGGDVEDLAFFLTAMKEGGINASEGANALKSGLASLINPSAKASEMLAGLGINIKSIVEGNAGDIKGTVIQFAQALDTLDPLNRARAIEQLFGKFQFSRLSTLFQNVVTEGTQASRVLGLTAASTEELAILSERELKRIESSPLFKFRKSFEDLKVAMAPVGEEFLKAVTPIIEFGTKLLEKFNSMSDGGKQFVTILVAGLGVVAPTLLMIIGLVGNGVANIAKFMLFLKGMGRGGAGIQQLGMQTEYMTQQQLEANAAASALSQTHSRLQQAFTSETAAVKALAAAYREAAIASKALMTVPAGRGGAARAARAAPKATGLAKGILSVPGPKGAGDVVPAMLSPGEAVIPADKARKYAPLISGMIAGNIPGYRFGFNPFAMMLGRSRVAARMPQSALMSMISQGPGARYSNAYKTQTGADYIDKRGKPNPKAKALRGEMEEHVFGIDQSAGAGARPTYGYARISPIQAILNRIFGLKGKQFNAVAFGQRIGDIGTSKLIRTPSGNYIDDPTYKRDALAQYGDVDIVTNRSVSKRSTAIAGDAFLSYRHAKEYYFRGTPLLAPAPMRGATQEQTKNASFDANIGARWGRYNPDPIHYPNAYSERTGPDYIETHTPGGFGVNEISRIIAKDRTAKKAIQEALKASGLKIRVTDQNFATKLFQALGIPGFEDGIFSVPGPKGAGDVVPAMLSPGEAVIPADKASKYSGFINAMISGNIPGFEDGLTVPTFGEYAIRLQDKTENMARRVSAATSMEQILAPLAMRVGEARGLVPSQSRVLSGAFDDIAKEFSGVTQKFTDNLKKEYNGTFKDIKDTNERYRKAWAAAGKSVEKDVSKIKSDVDRGVVRKTFGLDPDYLGTAPTESRRGGQKLERGRKSIRQGGPRSYLSVGPGAKALYQRMTGKSAAEMQMGHVYSPVSQNLKTLSSDPKASNAIKKAANMMGVGIQNAVVSGVKESTKQKSPSRAARQSGANIGTGAIQGIESAVDDAKLAGTKLGQAAASGVSQSQRGSVASRIETKVNKSGQTYYVLDGKRISEDKAKTAFANQERARRGAETREAKRVAEAAAAAKRSESARKAAETRARNRADRLAAAPPVAQGGQQAGARGGMGMGGVGMLAMTAGMMAPMLPGKAGEVGGQLAGPLMALGMLSMLPPQIALVTAALGILGFGIYKYIDSINKARDAGIELANAMSSTSKEIQSMSEFSGTVSATELKEAKQEKRMQGISPVADPKFGQSFVDSEAGVNFMQSVKSMQESGLTPEQMSSSLGDRLTNAMLQGVITNDQARSIVMAIGQQLDDYSIPMKINAQINELAGLGGINVQNDPFAVSLKLQENAMKQQTDVFEKLQDVMANVSQDIVSKNMGRNAIITGASALVGGIAGGILTAPAAGAGAIPGAAIGGSAGATAGVLMNQNEISAAQTKVAAQAVTVGFNAIDLSQQQLDIVDQQYSQRLADLEVAKEMATTEAKRAEILGQINALEQQYSGARESILANNSKILETIKEQAAILGGAEFSRVSQQVTAARYEGTGLEEFAAETGKRLANTGTQDGIFGIFENLISASKAVLEGKTKEQFAAEQQAQTDFRVSLETGMAAGELDFTTVDRLLDLAEEDPEIITKYNFMVDEVGLSETNQAIVLLEQAGLQPDQFSYTMQFLTENKEDWDDNLQALAYLGQIPGLYGFQIDVSGEEGAQKIADLQNDLASLEEYPDVISKDMVISGAEKGNQLAQQFLSQWDEILGSATDVNKTMLITFATLMAGDEDLVGAYVSAKGMSARAAESFSTSANAEEIASAYFLKQNAAGFSANTGLEEDVVDSGGGAEPKIDSLLKKLRDLRLATIDMKKGWEGMQEVLESVFAGGTKGIDVFEGLSNQIRKMGVGENLIEMIVGMDPDEYNKRKGELFVFDKAGNIIQTTAKLKNMQSAFNAIAIGEYVNEQQSFIENTKNQISAISILTANGMSLSEAYQLVQDEALAAAIAMGATKAEIQEIIRITGLAQQQRQNMEKEQEKSRISESVRKTNEEFKNQVNILNQLSKARGQYSDAQIQAILNDPDLQKLFLNPSIDPRALQEALNNANKQANLELSIKKLTVSGQEEIFQTGLSAAMSAFSAKEQEIDIQFRATIADDESLIKSAENQLAKIDFELDDYQAALQEIGWAEQKINDSYKDRFDALSKVSELNDQITASKARQLDLADALSRGDIAAAAKAAQEMRSQEQSNAIEMQRSMMETAQQTEIARLRSSGGLSRDQLEEKILQLEKERFGIEENTIEPAQERIRLEQIQRDLRVADLEVLGKTRDEWEAIGNRIDVAQANGWKFADAMKEALNIVETLVGSLLNRPIEVETPIPSGGGGGGGGGAGRSNSPIAAPNGDPGKPITKLPILDSRFQPSKPQDARFQPSKQFNPVNLGARPSRPVSIPRTVPNIRIGRKASGGMIIPSRMAMGGSVKGYPMGGLIPYKAEGGFFKSLGSDTVPAMLTPGEFVVRRPAVKGFGKDNLEKINRGTYEGNSVYNYNLEVNVKSGSNPNEIANTVMRSIKQVEGRRIRGNNL